MKKMMVTRRRQGHEEGIRQCHYANCRKPVYKHHIWDGSKIIGASCGEVSANGRSARSSAGS